MRRIPFFLPLLLASSAALAQPEGVLVFKSEQPYVSPFDKAPEARPAAMLPPAAEVQAPIQKESATVEAREIDKKETQKRAQTFVSKAPPKPVVVRKEEVRKKEPVQVAVKKEEKKAAAPAKTESKPAVIKPEASLIPPKDAQNLKAELTPPPALVVKETGLTSFSKETPFASLPTTPEPVDVVEAPIVLPVVEAGLPAVDTASNGSTSLTASDSSIEDSSPAWILKAIVFFLFGAALMAGAWHWIKRQALYGDPAFQDPWFRPVKAR